MSRYPIMGLIMESRTKRIKQRRRTNFTTVELSVKLNKLSLDFQKEVRKREALEKRLASYDRIPEFIQYVLHALHGISEIAMLTSAEGRSSNSAKKTLQEFVEHLSIVLEDIVPYEHVLQDLFSSLDLLPPHNISDIEIPTTAPDWARRSILDESGEDETIIGAMLDDDLQE